MRITLNIESTDEHPDREFSGEEALRFVIYFTSKMASYTIDNPSDSLTIADIASETARLIR